MPKGKRYSPEQIISKLREAEILLSQGKSVEEAARVLEIVPLLELIVLLSQILHFGAVSLPFGVPG